MKHKNALIALIACAALSACSGGSATKHVASGLNGSRSAAGIVEPSKSPSPSPSPSETSSPTPSQSAEQSGQSSTDTSQHSENQSRSENVGNVDRSQHSSVSVENDQSTPQATRSSNIRSGVTKQWDDEDESESVETGNVTPSTQSPSTSPSTQPSSTDSSPTPSEPSSGESPESIN